MTWKREAMQLRENHLNNSAAIWALVDLFESELDHVHSPLLCLALHHAAMRFHKCAGKNTLRKMSKADLKSLPEAIFPSDRIPETNP